MLPVFDILPRSWLLLIFVVMYIMKGKNVNSISRFFLSARLPIPREREHLSKKSLLLKMFFWERRMQF